ncbi:hypothetical protein [Pseudoalteromonas sp. T1lg22]|uniref:hypothetical protein n=1 Tax=Pseudoalteromonas sp. T1lg22 TaxID=2077096 RepID=UPI000CF6B2FA|nr:hypothetical protein [Pseudoalteromonas sp. T1lg22]
MLDRQSLINRVGNQLKANTSHHHGDSSNKVTEILSKRASEMSSEDKHKDLVKRISTHHKPVNPTTSDADTLLLKKKLYFKDETLTFHFTSKGGNKMEAYFPAALLMEDMEAIKATRLYRKTVNYCKNETKLLEQLEIKRAELISKLPF